jgi:GntR family transcriptional regulator / MocR family aminotransferase
MLGSVEQIAAVAQRASESGVEVQQLARFGIAAPRAGVVVGYGAIPSARIAAALRLLRRAFTEILGG